MRHFLQVNRLDVVHKVKFYTDNVRQRKAVNYAIGGVFSIFNAAALKKEFFRILCC